MSATHDNAGIAAWKFKLKAEIHSYDDCDRFIREQVSKQGAVKVSDVPNTHASRFTARGGECYDYDVGPQMRVVFKHNCYAIVLYNTEIIRYYPDGTFSVDNGGYNTITTKERLQAFVPQGFIPFHHRKRLCLRTPNGDWNNALEDLNHSKRITADGEIKEVEGEWR